MIAQTPSSSNRILMFSITENVIVRWKNSAQRHKLRPTRTQKHAKFRTTNGIIMIYNYICSDVAIVSNDFNPSYWHIFVPHS